MIFLIAARQSGGVTVEDIMAPMYEDGRLNLAALDEHNRRITALLSTAPTGGEREGL